MDPLTGRWMSKDPIGERGGVNLYGFVGNDPITRIDFLGMDKITLNISFVETNKADDGPDYNNASFDAGLWAQLLSGLPHVKSVPFPDFHDGDKERSAKYWELLRKQIESVLQSDDCIIRLNIRAHGNDQEIGGMHADQMADGLPQRKFFEWLRTRKCKGDATMEIMACHTALGDSGKTQIRDLAIASGFWVKAFDGQYAVIGWGNQWTANPDGSKPREGSPPFNP